MCKFIFNWTTKTIGVFVILLSTTFLSAQTQTFSFTGSMQTFTVPVCVNSATIIATGASGVTGTGTMGGLVGLGGQGGILTAVMSLTPGMVLNVCVGGQNGFNGGGIPGSGGINPSGNGGGASDIRINGTALSDRVIVAAGGGGGGGGPTNFGGCGINAPGMGGMGGYGGNLTGQSGSQGYFCSGTGGPGGLGASQSNGGNGASGYANGTCPNTPGFNGFNGALGIGGNGGNGTTCYVNEGSGGGGGGGGYYGGGGAAGGTGSSGLTSPGGGGGGGSSYVNSAIATFVSFGNSQLSDGEITIIYSPITPGAILNIAPSTTLCSGNPATISYPNMLSYTWSTGSNLSSIIVYPTTTTSYSLMATNSLGCVLTATTNIVVNPLPQLVVSTTTPVLCIGQTATLTAYGATSYTWNNGTITSLGSTTTANPLQTTTYSLSGLGSNGCVNTINYTVALHNDQLVTNQYVNACSGTSVVLSASGAFSYTWSNGFFTPSILVPANTSSLFTVTSLDNSGCTSSKTVTLNVTPSPTITIAPHPTIVCIGSPLILTALGGATYSWTTGASTNTVDAVQSSIGAYIYSVSGNSEGCSKTASTKITVASCTGVNDEHLLQDPITIFPNPSEGVFKLLIPKENSSLIISVFSAEGHLIKTQNSYTAESLIDLRDEVAGFYFVRISENGTELWTKLIKID